MCTNTSIPLNGRLSTTSRLAGCPLILNCYQPGNHLLDLTSSSSTSWSLRERTSLPLHRCSNVTTIQPWRRCVTTYVNGAQVQTYTHTYEQTLCHAATNTTTITIFPSEPGTAGSPWVLLRQLFKKITSGDKSNRLFMGRCSSRHPIIRKEKQTIAGESYALTWNWHLFQSHHPMLKL